MKKTSTILLALIALPAFAAESAKPDVNPAPPCTARTAACLQKIANLYLEALRIHDGSKLPLWQCLPSWARTISWWAWC